MNRSFFTFVLFFLSLRAYALEGADTFEKKLLESNQDYLSLQNQIDAKEALTQSTRSGFYPTLNAVAGYGRNRTDDIVAEEKGYIGYLEGRLNLFRGFKDQVIQDRNAADISLSKLDLETKKRDLHYQVSEAISNMILLHKLQIILNEEFKVTQSQKQMASRKVAAGLTGSVDNLEFDLRESEIQLEKRQIDQQHEQTHQLLGKIFGQDILDADLEKLEFSSLEKLLIVPAQMKIEDSLDYQKVDLSDQRARMEYKEYKADFLPSVDFIYSAGRLTPSDESPLKLNESKYALLITIPLFSGFDSYSRLKSSSFLSSSTEKLKRQRRIDVTADFAIAKTKMNELGALYQINESKLALSQKYFDLTLSEYKRGVKNSPDLVTATERLFSCKKRHYELLKELELIKVKIENLI